jgi:hypothetical protein
MGRPQDDSCAGYTSRGNEVLSSFSPGGYPLEGDFLSPYQPSDHVRSKKRSFIPIGPCNRGGSVPASVPIRRSLWMDCGLCSDSNEA